MTKSEIKELVESNKIVLFMKGTPDWPQCGFSQKASAILRAIDVDFVSKDVLESEELRQSIKEFSSWPTIPQLYVNGEFIGGCDIMLEMYRDGSLKETVGN
jgi:monothiol glutaredoxin